jgi:hypothetical protein
MPEIKTIRANEYALEPEAIDGGTSGSFGDIKLSFEFSDGWKDLSKKVVFHPVRGAPVEVLLLDSTSEIDVPPEATAVSGVAHFVLCGYVTDSDNVTRNIISLPGKINVKPTYKAKGGNTKKVTKDNFSQLLDAVKGEINNAIEDAVASGEFKGDDGVTPHIGSNGNWYIGDTDTGISAKGTKGDNGITPHIGDNGNWYIGTTDTGISAKGVKGDPGENGKDGDSGVFVSETESATPPESANVWVVIAPTGEQTYILVPDKLRYVNGRLQLMCGDETVGDPVIIGSGSGGTGADGVTFTPSVSADGVISWTNDGGKDNPAPVNIKGNSGTDGVGVQSVVQTTTSTADGGDNIITVTLTNGNTATFTVKNGSKGSDGSSATVTVDSALSDSSTNPVQNKVIKAELDKKIETVPSAGANIVGGIKADDATAADTQPVRKGTDGKLYTTPTSGGTTITVDSEMSDTSTNPVQNKVAKAYMDKFKATVRTANIGTTWTGSEAPYTQTLSVLGVTADSVVDIFLSSDATASQVTEYGKLNLQDGGQSAKSITLKAFGTKNTATIPIKIIIRGEP